MLRQALAPPLRSLSTFRSKSLRRTGVLCGSKRGWFKDVRSPAVLFVAPLFHPHNDLAIKALLNGDMGHMLPSLLPFDARFILFQRTELTHS